MVRQRYTDHLPTITPVIYADRSTNMVRSNRVLGLAHFAATPRTEQSEEPRYKLGSVTLASTVRLLQALLMRPSSNSRFPRRCFVSVQRSRLEPEGGGCEAAAFEGEGGCHGGSDA